MPIPLDARHIAGADGDFAPQHQNHWSIEIAGLDGDDKDLIILSLESSALPTEGNNVVEIPYGNETRKVAGKATFEDIPLVVKDFVDRETRNALVRWRREVYDSREGTIGLPSTYKKLAELLLYSSDGSILRRCKLHGSWPSSMNPGSLDMNSDSQVMIEMTVTYDRSEWVL